MLRQIEFAEFDMRLHQRLHPAKDGSALGLLERCASGVAVLKPPAYNRFPNNFSHIFAGGYAAGYYSYKWRKCLGRRYGAFEEMSESKRHSGHEGRRALPRRGTGGRGSRPAAESFAPSAGAAAERRCPAQATVV